MVYYLSDHVHACMASGHVVFLDVKSDAYSALPPEDSRLLKGLVEKRFLSQEELAKIDINAQGILKKLESDGLVQTKVRERRSPSWLNFKEPELDLSEANLDGYPSITFRQFLNFFCAWAKAVITTKIFGIRVLEKYLTVTKPKNIKSTAPMDLRKLIAAFRVIRAFFYTAHDHCYFDCAVAMYFLRRYGFDPIWVYAVKMEPFHAHCWVQVDDIIVTDFLGSTDRLQPIMVI